MTNLKLDKHDISMVLISVKDLFESDSISECLLKLWADESPVTDKTNLIITGKIKPKTEKDN